MLSYLLAALESEEDKRRFTELYEENHVRAEQTALRILRDPHDAEDAVQNAFLQVIHHFDEISEIPCKKLGFWIISNSEKRSTYDSEAQTERAAARGLGYFFGRCQRSNKL